MKLEYVERGIHRRGRRLIVSFALSDGRIERRSVGLVSVEEARRRLLNWKHDVDMGTYQKKQPRKPEPKVVVHTCKLLWNSYVLDYRVIRERKDEARLTTAWEHLEGTFASVPVADVTTQSIKDYVASRRAEGAANGTINRELALLHAMFRYGTRVTPPMVDRMPAFPSRLQEPPPRTGFVDDQKYNTLARNAKDLWMRALIACYYNFGFRKGEMLGLRVEQVDLLDRRMITLYAEQTKTEKARKVKMTNEVFQLLSACCEGKKPDDYVFTREDGSRVVDLRQEWYELCVASNLGSYVRAKRRKTGAPYDRYVGLNLHDFRRSAIRNMVRRGVSDTVAMKISGHKTRGIFDRYNIGDEKDLEKASALIEAGAERETQSISSTDTKTYTRPLARTARPS